MPSYADDDLISLADSAGESIVVVTPTPSTTDKMANNGRAPTQRESFSGLTSLMKAKKPYTPIPPPSPRPPLSIATNSMQFASRFASGNSMVSPLARPYHTDGSVAAYLQDQAYSPPDVTSPIAGYRQRDMQHLESIFQELNGLPVDEDDYQTVQDPFQHEPTATAEPLLPNFEVAPALPIRRGPIAIKPAEPIQPPPLEEPIVRVTMHNWDAMGRDMEKLKYEKRELEAKVARLQEAQQQVMHNVGNYGDDLQTQIGKLQYQNEANRAQKATMARTLSEKDVQIKQLQLEIDNLKKSRETLESAARDSTDVVVKPDYLQATTQDDNIRNARLLANLTAVKNGKIETLAMKIGDPQEALGQTSIEHDAAARTHTNSEYHKAHAQKLADQLTQREKLLRSTQEKYAAEHTKVGELEDHLKDLQCKLSQVGDLQGKLREKSSECDRYRTKLRYQEKIVEASEQRVLRASNNGASLRWAAHLVKPQASSRLPALVLGCSECYAKNISCDNKARCRHCTENNEICARWRCSLKHVLGQCPDSPCHMPHDDQGWLLQSNSRPQW